MMTRLYTWLAGIAGLLIAFLGMFAKMKSAEAKAAQQDADISEHSANAAIIVDNAVYSVEQKHIDEQRKSDADLAQGKRDHFEGDW